MQPFLDATGFAPTFDFDYLTVADAVLVGGVTSTLDPVTNSPYGGIITSGFSDAIIVFRDTRITTQINMSPDRADLLDRGTGGWLYRAAGTGVPASLPLLGRAIPGLTWNRRARS